MPLLPSLELGPFMTLHTCITSSKEGSHATNAETVPSSRDFYSAETRVADENAHDVEIDESNPVPALQLPGYILDRGRPEKGETAEVSAMQSLVCNTAQTNAW